LNKNDISTIKGNIKYNEFDSFLRQIRAIALDQPKDAPKLMVNSNRMKKSKTRPIQRPPLIIDHFKFNNPPGLVKEKNRRTKF